MEALAESIVVGVDIVAVVVVVVAELGAEIAMVVAGLLVEGSKKVLVVRMGGK